MEQTNHYDVLTSAFTVFADWHILIIVCVFLIIISIIFRKQIAVLISPKPDPSLQILREVKSLVTASKVDFDKHINNSDVPLRQVINDIQKSIGEHGKAAKSMQKQIVKIEKKLGTCSSIMGK